MQNKTKPNQTKAWFVGLVWISDMKWIGLILQLPGPAQFTLLLCSNPFSFIKQKNILSNNIIGIIINIIF